MHQDGSSVMFPLGSPVGGGSSLTTSDPLIDLMPTPIPTAKLQIFHTRQMTAEMVLLLQQKFQTRFSTKIYQM